MTERAGARVRPFDLSPCIGATLSDLLVDFLRDTYLRAAVAPEVLDANARPFALQLQALSILTAEEIPTVVGVLVAGREPTRWLPGAYVQFVRFEGTELSDPIRSAKEAHGPIGHQVRYVEEVLEAQIDVAIRPGPVEQRTSDFPMPALREIVRNAILHRSYENTGAPVHVRWFTDRIEVLSPGGPYGAVTKDNFGTPGLTALRNPNLAEAMRNLGLVQRFGVGIEIARRELARNGNPPPEFTVTDTHVHVTLRKRS